MERRGEMFDKRGLMILFLFITVSLIAIAIIIIHSNFIFAESSYNTTTELISHLWLGNSYIETLAYDSANDLIYFTTPKAIGSYNRTSGVTSNLTALGFSSYDMVYDPYNDLIYIGGIHYNSVSGNFEGILEAYNKISNDLTEIPNDFITSLYGVDSLAYDADNHLIYFGGGVGKFGSYNSTSGAIENLSALTDYWAGSGTNHLFYNPDNKLIYIADRTFGFYNATSNTSVNLNNTNATSPNLFDPGSSSSPYETLAYDSYHNLIYFAGYEGRFGYYNISSNLSYNLNTTDAGDWIGESTINSLAYDSNMKLIYLAGDSGIFGYYNLSNNNITDLRGTDPIDWIQTNEINKIVYNPADGLIYLGGIEGVYGYYNLTENITTDLNVPNDWVRYNEIYSLLYNPSNKLVYFGGDYVFGAYDSASNTKIDLRNLSAGYIKELAYASSNNLIYIGGSKTFNAYDSASNVIHRLNATNATGPNWLLQPNDPVRSLTYDSKHNLIYLCGDDGIFAYYNISSNISYNLNYTDTNNWIGEAWLFSDAYDSSNDLVYLAGNKGAFGAYNIDDGANGTVHDLRGAAANVMNSSDSLFSVIYSPFDESIYFAGRTYFNIPIFARYKPDSNNTDNLNGTIQWATSDMTAIWSLAYDSDSNLIYFAGQGGMFGMYNITSGTSEDLSGTDANNWIASRTIEGLAYNPNTKLVYLAGATGLFGYYNRTSNSSGTFEISTGNGQNQIITGIDHGTPAPQTQTFSWPSITPTAPATATIQNESVSLVNITITTNQNVSAASLSLLQVDPQNAGFMTGTDGLVYQAFEINTVNLNYSNIATVIIGFRINKTWAQENSADPEKIVLYRKPTNVTQWSRLLTTQTGEDNNYYYYSALSLGFSTFVVFSSKGQCNPEQIRCSGKEIQFCNENSTWTVLETCPAACRGGRCTEGLPSYIYYGSGIGVVLGIMLVIYLIIRKTGLED